MAVDEDDAISSFQCCSFSASNLQVQRAELAERAEQSRADNKGFSAVVIDTARPGREICTVRAIMYKYQYDLHNTHVCT